MKTIYLDQNIWIQLAQVYYGRNKDPTLKKICGKIIKISDSDKAIFPISVTHLMETSNRLDLKTRGKLVDFIIKISKGYTIAPYNNYYRNEEIKQAVFKKLNKPYRDLSKEVIKEGVSNLFGAQGIIKGNIPKIKKDRLLRFLNTKVMLSWLLKNGNPNHIKKNNDQELLDKLEKLRKETSKIKDKDLRFRAEKAKFICSSLFPKVVRIGISLGVKKIFKNEPPRQPVKKLKQIDLSEFRKEIEAFFQSIPAAYVSFNLDYRRSSLKERPIHKNDNNDIFAFSMAIPYCDIVVGEKMFISLAKQTKLDKLYNTVLLQNIKELEQYL